MYSLIIVIAVFFFLFFVYCLSKGYFAQTPEIETVRLPNGVLQVTYHRSSWLGRLWNWLLKPKPPQRQSFRDQRVDAEQPEVPSTRCTSTQTETSLLEDDIIPYTFLKCVKKLAEPDRNKLDTEVMVQDPSPQRPVTQAMFTGFMIDAELKKKIDSIYQLEEPGKNKLDTTDTRDSSVLSTRVMLDAKVNIPAGWRTAGNGD